MSVKKNNNKRFLSDAIVQEVIEAIASLNYGSVLIKVHDGKVVQIEVTKRKRFNEPWEVEKGGGI